MADKKIRITVKRDRQFFSHREEAMLFEVPEYCIPLPYESTSDSKCVKSSDINPGLIFGRSGIIPFLVTDEGPVILLTVYKGLDRGKKVLNMSDFGGRTEKGEDFLTTACWEAAEESLGLVNFIDRNNSILKESQSSYNEDLSVIVTAVPTKYDGDINDLVSDYSILKKDFNGELEDDDFLPPFVGHNRSIVFHDKDVERLELVNKAEDTLHKTRYGTFNTNETRYLVYVKLKDVKRILSGVKCPLPCDLSSIVQEYHYYPKIYYAVSKHLTNLIPYIEEYSLNHLRGKK